MDRLGLANLINPGEKGALKYLMTLSAVHVRVEIGITSTLSHTRDTHQLHTPIQACKCVRSAPLPEFNKVFQGALYTDVSSWMFAELAGVCVLCPLPDVRMLVLALEPGDSSSDKHLPPPRSRTKTLHIINHHPSPQQPIPCSM